jgi:hypothetical protein
LQPRFRNFYAGEAIPKNTSFFIFSFDPFINDPRTGQPGTPQLMFGDILASAQENNSSYGNPGKLGSSQVFHFQNPQAPVAQAASELAKAFIEIRQTKEAVRFRVDPKSKRPAIPPNMVYMSRYDLMQSEDAEKGKIASK